MLLYGVRGIIGEEAVKPLKLFNPQYLALNTWTKTDRGL